jgi:outer membrane biogenesis lipoprotein LolB
VRRSALIIVALLLAGCAHQTEDEAKAENEAKDGAQCQAHGYQPGTLKYDDCMSQLADLRTQAERSAFSNRLLGRPLQ